MASFRKDTQVFPPQANNMFEVVMIADRYGKIGGLPKRSQFNEGIVAQRTPVVELNSAYGTSAIRDIITVANNATVNAVAGEIRLRTAALANSSAHLDTAEAGRYIPGYGAEVGIGVRIPTAPTGDCEMRWGAHSVDELNGFFFGYNSNGMFVARMSNGVVSRTYQNDWSIDKLNGTGVSGYTLSPASGVIYQIDFTWYGYGQIKFAVVDVIGEQQGGIFCHSIKIANSVSVQSPNMQVFAEVNNHQSSNVHTMFVGGRQYSIVGQYRPYYRYTGQARPAVNTSTTAVPIVSFRRKTAFLDRSVRLEGITAFPATENVIVEVRLNGTLTGASWITPTNHTAAETALETDISATAITGGTVVWSEFFPAGTANKGQVGAALLELEIPAEQPISLCVRTLSGTGTCLGFLRMKEEW